MKESGRYKGRYVVSQRTDGLFIVSLVSGNKANVSFDNLKALCKECHSKQPYHEYMKD